MITNFDSFKTINENNYVSLKDKYGSLGDYVEHLHSQLDDEDKFEEILGEFLKVNKKKNNSKKFEEGDYVLMEYWYKDMITPVKILEKKGRKYNVTHNIEESEIKNAPDEVITRDLIIDHFRETHKNRIQKNIPTDIRISNAVNLMNPYDQMLLVKKIHDEFNVEENVKFEIEEIKNLSVLGKVGFNTFMKVLSALNLPNIEIDRDNCPNDFFVVFVTEVLNKQRLLKVMDRFRSMSEISDILSQNNDNVRIYFGMKYNNALMMEYGIIKDQKRIVVGEYKLTKSLWRKLKDNNSKPLKSLKEEISKIDIKDLKKLMRIKGDITNFSPGFYREKTNPYIENNVLIQGYEGTGKWDNGTITTKSYDNIKSEFKKWVITQKWAKDVEFNIKPDRFWVWVKIKLR